MSTAEIARHHLIALYAALEQSAQALEAGADRGELFLFLDLCDRVGAYTDDERRAAHIPASFSDVLPSLGVFQDRASALLGDASGVEVELLQRGEAFLSGDAARGGDDDVVLWASDVLQWASASWLSAAQQVRVRRVLRSSLDLMELHPDVFAAAAGVARQRMVLEPTDAAPPYAQRLLELMADLDLREEPTGSAADAEVVALLAAVQARSGLSSAEWQSLVEGADAAIQGFSAEPPSSAVVIPFRVQAQAPQSRPLALAASTGVPWAEVPLPDDDWQEKEVLPGVVVRTHEDRQQEQSRFFVAVVVDPGSQIDLTKAGEARFLEEHAISTLVREAHHWLVLTPGEAGAGLTLVLGAHQVRITIHRPA